MSKVKAVSKIAEGVHASTTLAVDSLAKQMKEDGYDVIRFGTGEPDFNTPDNINMAAIAAICDGKTKYTPAAGIPALRKAIAKQLQDDCGLSYDYTQIVVASGAKHSVYIALAAITNPGDEIIIPAPFWVSYYEMVKMTGGVPVIVTAGEESGFKVTASQIETAITDKTKCLMLNNPSNPTGMIYSKDELKSIAEVCVKHDLYILADEIYYKLIYDGIEFTSIASLGDEVKERCLLINGVSKSYAMTGWRIGYCAANKQLAKIMSNYLSHSTGAPSTISQWAAVEAINGPQQSCEEMRKAFEERRDYIVQRMNSIPGVSCIKPNGAFYVMMNIEKLIGRTLGGKLITNDDDFAVAFLESAYVATVPCSGFGMKNFIRWSYAASMDNIKEALDRLEKFLAQ
ncbi:MAG: pyridoxal phosphate-dependent aminotransferase [Oscillospiraceae bacterium]|nr:pyridoxal phosphate-dependent aminotransferase [Oscillospiraceae bacterium]